MTYTSHGHRIPNSPADEETPKSVTRCGGMRFCAICASEAGNFLESSNEPKNVFDTNRAEPLVHTEAAQSACSSSVKYKDEVFPCTTDHGTSASRVREHASFFVTDAGQYVTLTWMKD